MKKYLSLMISLLLIFSCNVCAEEEIASPQRLLYLNADDVGSKIGSSQVPRTTEFNGRNVFDHDFSISGSLYYIPWVRTDSNMDTNKKYIYHAEYYPNFDTPTGYVEGMWLNISGTDTSGIQVTPKTNSHPSEDDYRYYSYYYKNEYTDLYTTGFFNGYIKDDLSASNEGLWPWNSNEMVLKTKEWNTYELVLTKPLDSKFQIYPFVSSKFENGISGGDRIYFDDAYLEELALGKIELNKNGSSIANKTLKTKKNFSIAFSGDVFNQFNSSLGFKDRHGRVMEPLKFEIYNEDGELISTSAYGESPTNMDIYVETKEDSYKLKASKDGKTTWDIPTYNFNIKTSENIQKGIYTIKASLLNKDIFGSENYTEFNLEVLSEDSYTADETEPETLIWLIGDDEENKLGSQLTVSMENGKNETAGYVFDFSKTHIYNVVSDSENLMSAEKKYIYTADYLSDSDSFKISLNGEETDFNLKSGEWNTFEQLISDNDSEVFTVSHTAATGEKPIVYADNIRMQELSVGSITLSETPKSIVRNHQFDFSCVLLNQFGTETGFLGEELQFDIYSSVGNHIGTSTFSDGENKTSGNITVSAKTITQNGDLLPTNEYTVNISSATVSDTYTVVASLCDKNIHNSDLTASFDIKVTKEKDYPKGNNPHTLLWANGDDASFGRSLGEVVYNKGVDGTNAYKQTFEKDGGTYYLKPYPHTELMTDPSKKYIYHADYYVDFETSNGKTTTNWMLWSSADDEGLRVTGDSGEHPSNEDYRYYSYYPGFTGTDVYVKGVFRNIINPDLTMSDSVWNASNMFVLKQKEWTTYEALVSKQEIKRFNVYGLFGKSNDDVVGKPVYIDNVCFQELALNDIEIYNGATKLNDKSINVKRGENVSISAEVYNQFGSTLGFKDREGRVMEPLCFSVYDEEGNEVFYSDFQLEDTTVPFGIYFETQRNEYTLQAPKNGMEKWVYPTYDFSLNISDEFPCGEYKVVAKLQNEDIFGSEKTVEFDLVIEENSSVFDFEILGESEITVSTEGHKLVTYTNSMGETGEWRLPREYNGVSVSKGGVLCVENIAEHGDIYLICEINKDGKRYLSSKRIVISGEMRLSIENNSIYSAKLTDNTYFNYNRYLNIFSKDGSFIKSELVPQGLENYNTILNDNEMKVKLFVWDENMKPYSAVMEANANNLPLNIYVSVDGDDNNTGTFDSPLKTPQAARDMIREIKAQGEYPEKGINVIFREGTYRITSPLKLEKHDSGTVNSPIVYKAFENEKVTFSGADSLPSDKWSVVTDSEALSKIPSNAHGKVYEIDLGKLGYTADDIGQMNYWGIFANNNNQSDTPNLTAPAELYSDGEPQIVARYPNDGYIKIQTVYEPGGQWYSDKSKKLPFEIGYEDERTERWIGAKYAKLFGYWVYDYAESCVDIAKIDTTKKSITSKQTTAFGVKASDGVGGRYYIFNLLEELDTPGEYYTDLDTLKLYYYPDGNIEDINLKFAIFNDTLLNAYEASNLSFENINFSCSRSSGIWIQNCTNFKIKGCEICNFGSEAVVIYEGSDNSVSDSRIYNVTGGIKLVSNNGRETLTKSNNSAVNNEIYNFARSSRSSIPAITIDGCGNYVAKNTIHDGPHEGIWLLSANENIVEYNELYDLLNDTSDAGAIYCGHDWTQRGNIIRYNHIYDLGNGQENIEGIYLDETVSGYDIYSNIVGGYDGDGILINGGSDVLIHDNIFYNLGKRNLFMRYWADKSQGEARMNNVLSSPFRNDIWKEKYPNLYTITQTDPFFPQYCMVKNNLSIDNPENEIHDLVKEFSEVEDLVNVTSDVVTICDENGNLNIAFDEIKKFIPVFNVFDFNNIGSTIAEK